jgi:hypothetical protein
MSLGLLRLAFYGSGFGMNSVLLVAPFSITLHDSKIFSY